MSVGNPCYWRCQRSLNVQGKRQDMDALPCLKRARVSSERWQMNKLYTVSGTPVPSWGLRNSMPPWSGSEMSRQRSPSTLTWICLNHTEDKNKSPYKCVWCNFPVSFQFPHPQPLCSLWCFCEQQQPEVLFGGIFLWVTRVWARYCCSVNLLKTA